MKKIFAVIAALISMFGLALIAANFFEAAIDPHRAPIHAHAWIGVALMISSMCLVGYTTLRYITRRRPS